MVSPWKSVQYALAQAPLKAKKFGSGAKPQFPKEEQHLFDEICEKRWHGYTVSCSQIQAKLRQLVSKHRFRASTGWLYRFLHRHKLTLRACTTAINKVNSRMQGHNDEEKGHSFFQDVKRIVQTHNIVCMWNMDETPLYLDMPMKNTIETKGKRCIP